jgi:hypothetical protein
MEQECGRQHTSFVGSKDREAKGGGSLPRQAQVGSLPDGMRTHPRLQRFSLVNRKMGGAASDHQASLNEVSSILSLRLPLINSTPLSGRRDLAYNVVPHSPVHRAY